MRLEKTLPFEAGAVTVKELTVADVRALLADPARLELDDFEVAVVAEVSDGAMFPLDLFSITTLTSATLGAYAPSELRQVVALARELNGSFFGVLARTPAVLTPQRLYDFLSAQSALLPAAGTAPVSGITPMVLS